MKGRGRMLSIISCCFGVWFRFCERVWFRDAAELVNFSGIPTFSRFKHGSGARDVARPAVLQLLRFTGPCSVVMPARTMR